MRDFEFNFNCLLSSDGGLGERSSIFDVLYKLSHALRLKKSEFRTLLRRLEDGADHAHWSPSPESKLKMMTRQASPLDRTRLKDTREANSSMEILSDLLVSSIIDEVTGKAASTAAAPGSPGGPSSPAASAAEDDRGHGLVDHPDAPCRVHLFGALLETALLQISTMQHLAGKAMLAMASSRSLDPTLQNSISKFMQVRAFCRLDQWKNMVYSYMHFTSVQECVKTLSRDGIPQPPVKRRLPAAEVERAFSVVRSNPEQRRKLEHGEEVDEIETDVGKEVRLDLLLNLGVNSEGKILA